MNADIEINCVRWDFLPTRFNIDAAEQHVGDVERSIRYLKDCSCTQIQSLPFTHLPKAMVINCMMYVLKAINQLPSDNGLSKDISPNTLVMGDPPPSYHDICKLRFGDYVHTAYGATTSNNTARTVGAIALYPSGNTTGGWYMMSLLTGQILHRYNWKKIDVTADVLSQVTKLAKDQGQGFIGRDFKYSLEHAIPA